MNTQQPGFFFCVCADGQLLRREVERLLVAHAPVQGTDLLASESATRGNAWEKHVFWGDEELPRNFWEVLTLQGLFATPRALVLRNAQAIPAEMWRRLSKALGRPNPQTWPVLCLEVAFEKGQPKIPAHIAKLPCYTFAEKQGWVWRSAGLDERTFGKHIQSVAKELNLALAPGALEALTSILPLDAATVDNELTKLSLLMNGKPVTAQDAAQASFTPDFNIFQFLRQLQSGQTDAVWQQMLREQARGDDTIFPLLGLLVREARILWQVAAGDPVYVRPQELAAKKQTAARLGPVGLARLWDAAHTAELSIKSGQRSPAQALNALVADLTLLFASRSG